jgi:hypothetical protein
MIPNKVTTLSTRWMHALMHTTTHTHTHTHTFTLYDNDFTSIIDVYFYETFSASNLIQ